MKKLILGLFALGLLATVLGATYALTLLELPTRPFVFTLKPGSTLRAASRDLKQAGLLDQDWAFEALGRVSGLAGKLKAGSYELEEEVSPLRLLQMISRGEVSMGQVRVIEGWTFRQFRAALDADPDLQHDTTGLKDTEILERIGTVGWYGEGLFFPDTYNFNKGESDLEVLRRAHRSMQQNLQYEWDRRAEGLPFVNSYQALILASIVEKETGAPQDRPMIAAVFENRLRIGMPLQTDPSVIYGMGERFDGNLHKRDLLADTPYNTYTRGALPPTPISLPGLASLQAVLHPASSGALYFVARGDGTSEFSTTLDQHNQAVSRYQLKRGNGQ